LSVLLEVLSTDPVVELENVVSVADRPQLYPRFAPA